MKNTVTKSKSQWRKNEMNYLTKAQIFGMYLGHNVLIPSHYTGREKAVLTGVKRSNENIYKSDYVCTVINEDACNLSILLGDCKLILRPLSDITDEETLILQTIVDNTAGKIVYFKNSQRQKYTIPSVDASITEYLISIGIDVFDCHSKGWCIYESELQKGE
jgi:hypothetical protein